MKIKDQNIDYKASIPVGITFIGTGITFMVAVNPMIGAGILGIGTAFVIIGARQNRKNNA